MNKKNKKPNIAVIGDLMIDHYIWGECNRISPEAPVQIVSVKRESSVLGGAGNVINNLYSLGGEVSIFSVIGEDKNGREMLALINKIDIKESFIITESDRRTTKKSRIMASGQQIIRYDDETQKKISPLSSSYLLRMFKKRVISYDAIILSDYDKGVLVSSLTKGLIAVAKEKNIPILVDPKGENYSKYYGATLLTPNRKEATIATKIKIVDKGSLSKALTKLKEELKLEYSIITLSEDGIAFFNGDKIKIIPTVAKEVFDVTGAGDTIIASLGIAISLGMNIEDACKFSNNAAAVVVAKVGSATATMEEIEDYKEHLNGGKLENKIKNFKQIEKIVVNLKKRGKKIVFTNGCFDILHSGHVKYLQKAKELGDILILGLNSDSSIKRLKGKNRPINTLEDRSVLVAGLDSVDFVVAFEDDTPYRLIKLVRPHLLVKGADYRDKEVVGSDIVDEVKLIELVDGKSTTNLIEKILERC